MFSPEEIIDRRKRLGSSEVKPLMDGDAEAILHLYQVKIGERQPDNLDDNWPVQHGIVTEPLNLLWYGRKQGIDGGVSRQRELVVHRKYPWASCTLDGWDIRLNCPIECKACGGHEPLDPVIIDRYQPQCQYQMEITGAKQCALSVIMAGKAPLIEYLDRDDDYIAEIMRRGEKFMACVAARTPPVALPPVASPMIADKLYDMTGNNQWSDSAGRWLETREATQINKDAEKILKAMVPEDAKLCSGHLVRISRDRANRLSLREDK